MHILEAYSSNCRLKIKDPHLLKKFYPLNLNKYITLNTEGGMPAKNYDYFSDVIEILLPILNEHGIKVVQLGNANEKPMPGVDSLLGKTSFQQAAYIVSGSMLHLGVDSALIHAASSYNNPIVGLYSVSPPSICGPFWGDKNKQICLEPELINKTYSFNPNENPKTVNSIKPEVVASSVCKLLGLKFDYPYETVYVGENYKQKILESIPGAVTDISNLGVDTIVLRMDNEFNEEVLKHQINHCPVVVVTDKPINLELLKQYKERVRQLFYIINENHDVGFARSVQKLGIPLSMFSYLPENELNKFKLEYLDIGLILPKTRKTKASIKEIEGIPVEKLFYKSSKHTLHQGSIYTSKAAWLNKMAVSQVNQICPVIDSEEWFREIEHFLILKEK